MSKLYVSPHRRWGVFAAITAGLLLAYPLRYALIPFVVAGGLAFVATPAVEWLTCRFGLHRWVSATVVFVGFLLVLGGLGWWVKAVVFPDAVELTRSLPQMTRKLFTSAAGGDHVELFGHDITADAVFSELDSAARNAI